MVWATARYVGLRRGEIMALGRQDVDLSAGTLDGLRAPGSRSTARGDTTNRNRRPVPIAAALREHLAAGLERVTLHDCRNTFASFAIAAGVNAKALSAYTGHSRVAFTLDRCGHLMPGNEGEAAGLPDTYLDAATD